jgi:hypothetical protein
MVTNQEAQVELVFMDSLISLYALISLVMIERYVHGTSFGFHAGHGVDVVRGGSSYALVHMCIDDKTPLFESALAHMG